MQARWASKCPLELTNSPTVLLFTVKLLLSVEVVEIQRQKAKKGRKVERMWQCYWMRMGSPYFLWRLQHLYNQTSERKGQLGSVILSMRVGKPKSTTTPLPREIPKSSSQSLLASRAMYKVSNHGCDRQNGRN